MKKILLTIMLAAGFIGSAFAQDDDKKKTITLESSSAANIEFTKTKHDFGNIKEGTQATVEFEFKNTGDAPLVLTAVTASCGCTSPKWTKEPVAPGSKGSITVVYNSKNRPGKFTKTVTVKHNGEGGTQYLTISGFVEKQAAKPESPVQNDPN